MRHRSIITLILVAVTFIAVTLSNHVALAAYDPQIYQAQKLLKQRGYHPGALDGYWGKATQGAIERFQHDVGLPVTGRLDNATRAQLGIDTSARGVKVGEQFNEQRLALVIGNGDYKSGPLRNSVNDAHDMTSTLKKLGFTVIHRKDADQREIDESIREFGKRLRKGGVGLFYFAGHGMQLNGRNYLIPVDARIETESDVKYEAVDAGRMLGKMEDAGNRLNIVILDACRDNPFARSFRSADKGLARMDAPTGSLIAYATAPGQVAADGQGRNGTYTKYLLKHITVTGLTIEQVLKRVRIDVIASTGDAQVPWESSSLTGNFYFASSGVGVEKPEIPQQGASISVESNVQGASVFVDGRNVGATPMSNIAISVGKHVVLVEKPGYAPYQKRVTVEPGRSVALYVQLSGTVKNTARLYLDTEPQDAGVRILNINLNFYQGIELEVGRYQVEVSANGWETQVLWVTLDAGEDKNVVIRLERTGPGEFLDRFTNSLGMEFVAIPAGSFMMGSPDRERGRDDDERHHKVSLTRGFYMQTTEVTQDQWRAVTGINPSHFFSCGDDCPVENVSWEDVQEFIRKLNRKEGTDKYRLPTEAEWEYAARTGSNNAYSFGNNSAQLSGYAWYSANSSYKDHAVGQKKPNAWGLYDMHGNVWEWCQDWYGDYPSGTMTNPIGPSSGSGRVIRGGSWGDKARGCHSANRGSVHPGGRNSSLGFRLVKIE